MNEEQLIRYLVNHVDPQRPGEASEVWSDLARFEAFIGESSEAGKHPVVVVDEAHFLEQYGLLQPLRLLLNIGASEASGESAWTLVLVGEPTLLSQVERYHALDERLSVKCLLNRLREEETASYIQHRLRIAGAKQDDLFTPDAIQRIHVLSSGIPRRINRICDLSLMVGFAEDLSSVTEETVDQVHNDLAAPQVA
jgi:general secretion pathway protein A